MGLNTLEDKFVTEHKEEIDREAFVIYQQRERLCQEDTPVENYLTAIRIVKNRYKEKVGQMHEDCSIGNIRTK